MRTGVRPIGALAVAAALAGALLTGGVGARGPADADPPRTFAFAIGNGMLAGGPDEVAARFAAFDLVVADGELASADEIAALRAGDATVLAYLSVGTIERWRSWYPLARRHRLRAWQDWKDEWFADVASARLRRLLARRIAPDLLAKGFDGLFLDNVDMVEMRNHRRQRPGMSRLVLELADVVHADGRMLFAQNGLWGLKRLGLVDALDGWNREDVTWTYDFERRRYVRNRPAARRAALAELREMAARGKLVTATDYTRGSDLAARDEAVANACAAGALPYVSDIGLRARRLPRPPLACP